MCALGVVLLLGLWVCLLGKVERFYVLCERAAVGNWSVILCKMAIVLPLSITKYSLVRVCLLLILESTAYSDCPKEIRFGTWHWSPQLTGLPLFTTTMVDQVTSMLIMNPTLMRFDFPV